MHSVSVVFRWQSVCVKTREWLFVGFVCVRGRGNGFWSVSCMCNDEGVAFSRFVCVQGRGNCLFVGFMCVCARTRELLFVCFMCVQGRGNGFSLVLCVQGQGNGFSFVLCVCNLQ